MIRGRGWKPKLPVSILELGPTGLLALVGVLGAMGLVGAAFALIRPPTVEEVERDIWRTWAELTVDSNSETIVGQLDQNRRAACEQILEAFGEDIVKNGSRFVVHTDIRYVRIRDRDGEVFAEWPTDHRLDLTERGWRELDPPIVLRHPSGKALGTLEVSYRFYNSGLAELTSIGKLQEQYAIAMVVAVVLAALVLVSVFAIVAQIRERAARLQSQQVTLDLARQMCHELRNGLWAFSLEGKNIRQLFGMVDDYFAVQPEALDEAARKAGLDDKQRSRLQRAFLRMLTDRQVDPETDLLPCNDMAKQSHQQIESFSRYINLTVEELDRNLLGGDDDWNAQLIGVSEAWEEACELLAMRFKSAGVVHQEEIKVDNDLILGDRRALVHVFVNLAKNAVEAMRELPGNRELTFELEREGDVLVCRVSNTGRPIAGDVLPHIFNRGFSTKQGAGRGRGLSLVRESVERMNGDISVTSEQQTCFSIYFPSVQPESTAA